MTREADSVTLEIVAENWVISSHEMAETVVIISHNGIMQGLGRLAQAHLERWLESPRRKPLVIRGARQVGKSTLVRQLAEARDMQLLEVNLEQHQRLEGVFSSLDVSAILLELEAIGRMTPGPDTLLFLDEIQATPSAIAALRYLHEERPELPVIAAGSLLELVLQSPKFSMPVGRIEYLHLGPLSFAEFLTGVGDTDLLKLCSHWCPGDAWAKGAHLRLAARQREFLLVGGMPEAVAAYAAGEGIESVRNVQRSIVSTYRDDFAKYGANAASLVRLQMLFDYLPSAVGQKVKYANISKHERSRDLRKALDLLSFARVIWRVHHSDSAGSPLAAQCNPHVYKCLFMDVGLVSFMTGVDWETLGRWDDRQLTHESGLAEQFVGQHLLFRGQGVEIPSLCYWIREGKSTNAEVDYVIECKRSIVPVEVKSGTAGRLRSLHQFFAREIKSSDRLALRFDLNSPSLSEQSHRLANGREVHFRMLSLPLYMVDQWERLVRLVLRDES